jgi:alkylhydroperoxidase family enzyme
MPARIDPIDERAAPAEVQRQFAIAEERGAPNSKLLQILAREPDSLNAFYDAWNASFYGGRVNHGLKEIVRVRMARLRMCGY